jgi:hypothetical protein
MEEKDLFSKEEDTQTSVQSDSDINIQSQDTNNDGGNNASSEEVVTQSEGGGNSQQSNLLNTDDVFNIINEKFGGRFKSLDEFKSYDLNSEINSYKTKLEEYELSLKNLYNTSINPFANDKIRTINEFVKKYPDVPEDILNKIAFSKLEELSDTEAIILSKLVENPSYSNSIDLLEYKINKDINELKEKFEDSTSGLDLEDPDDKKKYDELKNKYEKELKVLEFNRKLDGDSAKKIIKQMKDSVNIEPIKDVEELKNKSINDLKETYDKWNKTINEKTEDKIIIKTKNGELENEYNIQIDKEDLGRVKEELLKFAVSQKMQIDENNIKLINDYAKKLYMGLYPEKVIESVEKSIAEKIEKNLFNIKTKGGKPVSNNNATIVNKDINYLIEEEAKAGSNIRRY